MIQFGSKATPGGVELLHRMEGKTVKGVEVGKAKHVKGNHQTEAARILFTDGSQLVIDTGSNVKNLLDRKSFEPHELSISLLVGFTPAPAQ